MAKLNQALDAFKILRKTPLAEIVTRIGQLEEELLVLKTLRALREIIQRDEDVPTLATDLDAAERKRRPQTILQPDAGLGTVLNYLREHGPVTSKEIAAALGWDTMQVAGKIKRLRTLGCIIVKAGDDHRWQLVSVPGETSEETDEPSEDVA